MSETPYETVSRPIEEWCKENYYTDFLVTIQIDGRETTEVLGFNGDIVDFVWLSDWWEGEKNVKLLGFSPIDDISLHNYPRRPITNADRFRAMTDEELAEWFGTHACCMKDPFFCSKPGGSCKACWIDWLRQEAQT